MAPDLADARTFTRVYGQHSSSVYATALRILNNSAMAQDVAQDVFLRLWTKPNHYDPRRGDLGSFLRLMARSRALDVYREGQAAGRATDKLRLVASRGGGEDDDHTVRAVERGDDRALVRAALERLPEAQREAVVLAHWGGLTAEEIAALTRIPLGTAKSRIRLGMTKLRGEVEQAA